VQVDGQSQQPVDGQPVAWHSRPEYDIAAAEHSGYPELWHRRTVFHPRGGYFLVLDELDNSSDRSRTAEWLLHVDGRRESGTRGRFVFRRDAERGLSVVPARGIGVRGSRIAEGPCALYVPGPRICAPQQDGPADYFMVPYVGLSRALAAGDSAPFCVALVPFVGGEPGASVELLQTPEAYFAEVTVGDTRDRIVVRRRGQPEGMARGLGLATDGTYAYVREVGGEVRVLDYVDGTTLSLGAW